MILDKLNQFYSLSKFSLKWNTIILVITTLIAMFYYRNREEYQNKVVGTLAGIFICTAIIFIIEFAIYGIAYMITIIFIKIGVL